MTTGPYQEGPFRNWTAVSFGLKATVTGVFDFLPEYHLITISGNRAATDVSEWQRVLTGADSSAQIDLSAVPLAAGAPVVQTSVSWPGCGVLEANWFTYAGIAIAADAMPKDAVNIQLTGVSLLVRQSHTADDDAEVCIPGLDAPTQKGFTLDEAIIFSDP